MKFRWLLGVCLLLACFPMAVYAQDAAPALNAAFRDLSSKLGTTVTTSNVQNYNWSQRTFTNRSLDCGDGSQVVGGINGFQIFITFNGRIYDYRVSADLGTVILCSGAPADGSATATPTSAPTLTPTNAPNITPTPGCFGFAAVRLQPGGFGRVISDVSANNIRNIPAAVGDLLGQIPPGGVFEVLEGPQCTEDDRAWWRVRYNDIEGWTSEGAGSDYLVEPITSESIAATSAAPTPTPTQTPAFACPGFAASRLVIGGGGRVISGASNNVRDIPSASGTLLGQIATGESFTVLEGPQCDTSGIAWWRVDFAGITGWTPEGQGEEYYVEPSGVVPTAVPQLSTVINISTSTVNQLSPLANLGWGQVYDVSWSPDGREVAILSTTGVRVFDTTDLVSAPIQTLNFVQSIPFGIRYTPDGRLAVIFLDRDSGLWDTSTGSQVVTFSTRDVRLDTITFSQDGSTAAYVTDEGQLRQLDLATGEVSETGSTAINGIYSSDGALVVDINTVDKSLQVISVSDGSEVMALSAIQPSAFTTLLSPSGQLIAVDEDSAIHVYDLASGESTLDFALPDSETGVLDVDLSEDGSTLSALYASGKAYIWDFPEGTLRAQVSHSTSPQQHKLSVDGSRLLISGGAWVSLWNTATGEQLRRLDQYAGEVMEARLSPDGTRIASAHADGTLRVWDTTSLNMVGLKNDLRDRAEESGSVFAVRFSPDGTLLAAASGSAIFIYDALTLELKNVWDNISTPGSFIQLAFSPDGTVLASAQGTVRLWDPLTGTLVSEFDTEGAALVAFSPDGSSVISNSTVDGSFTIWDVKSGESSRTVQPNAETTIQSFAFSPDSTLLAVGDTNSTLYIYDTTTFEVMQTLPLSAGYTWVDSMAFNTDGTLLAVGMGSGEGVAVVDPLKGQVINRVSPSSVRGLWASSIQFYPDSSRLLVSWGTGDGGGDGTFTLYGIPVGG